MKVIIIDHLPFSERRKQHFYIDRFINNGVNVEFWSLSKFLNFTKHLKFNEEYEEPYVRNIKSKKELFENFKTESKSSQNLVFILELIINRNTKKLYEEITKHSFKTVKIAYYYNPNRSLISNYNLTIIEKLKKTPLKHYISKIREKITPKLNHKYDLLFITGNDLGSSYPNAKKILTIDSFDIIDYQKIIYDKPILEYPYIVFLDIMLVNHPDIATNKLKHNIDKDKYYKRMNKFFYNIERSTGLPIVIAKHPRSTGSTEFGNRIYFIGKTAELINHCEFALTHGSLSISFALQAKKPLVYLYFNEMLSSNGFLKTVYDRINQACCALDSVKINIDNPNTSTINYKTLKVNKLKYKNFLSKYYSKQETTDNNFEIIFKEILGLFN